MVSAYTSRHFRITTVLCDGEGAFSFLVTYIQSKGIAFNTTTRNEHVPDIERAGKTLKKRVRAFWNTLPYILTLLMVVYLVYYCVYTVNMFPKQGSAFAVSPRELFLGRKVDYNRDCRIAFGDYVQVHQEDEITNTMAERTVGAIALGPVGNVQGGYRFLNLTTWKPIDRKAWTACITNA